MKVHQYSWSAKNGWEPELPVADEKSQLVLVFGETEALSRGGLVGEIVRAFPEADTVGCSTAGEILDQEVSDGTVVVSSVCFDKATVKVEVAEVEGGDGSYSAGTRLGDKFDTTDLKHVLVFSPGLDVNGTDLVQGLSKSLPKNVSVSGGLSGDGARFEKTLVVDRDRIGGNLLVGVGLYGESLEIRSASYGGWMPFGPERKVTKSDGNILYKIDNQSALSIYKSYLGEEHVKNLPSSGLLFPLEVKRPGEEESIVRTILAVSEEEDSITFAGDIPSNSIVRLMRANNNELIEGAEKAAQNACIEASSANGLALLVSCVGRKIVLKQRVEEEIEAVKNVLGDGVSISGFYSYGELSPFLAEGSCQLHNQTMTVTVIEEKV